MFYLKGPWKLARKTKVFSDDSCAAAGIETSQILEIGVWYISHESLDSWILPIKHTLLHSYVYIRTNDPRLSAQILQLARSWLSPQMKFPLLFFKFEWYILVSEVIIDFVIDRQPWTFAGRFWLKLFRNSSNLWSRYEIVGFSILVHLQ